MNVHSVLHKKETKKDVSKFPHVDFDFFVSYPGFDFVLL
jgi:hypothetical protein